MDSTEKLIELWTQLMEAVKSAEEHFEEMVKGALADVALYRDKPEYPYIRKLCPIVRVPQAYRAPIRRNNPP